MCKHKWQPIKTLPRDGRDILLRTTSGVVSAWFVDYGENPIWLCYSSKFSIPVEYTEIGYLESPEILGWMPIPE